MVAGGSCDGNVGDGVAVGVALESNFVLFERRSVVQPRRWRLELALKFSRGAAWNIIGSCRGEGGLEHRLWSCYKWKSD